MAQREDNGDTWCKHRTPLTHEYRVCKAGVDWRKFQPYEDAKPYWIEDMPCLGRCAAAIALCPKYEAHSAEYLAERHARVRKMIEDHRRQLGETEQK